jgi:hypothetical protein
VSWLSSLFRKKADPVPLWTGRVLTGLEFQRLLGTWEIGADSTYAEVNSAALPGYYDWFRTKLWDLGVTRWDQRQDCDDFANLYADLLQLRFYLAQWESNRLPDAEALAVARFWYVPSQGQGHAINAVATERGLLYIEPQTGQLVTISPQASRLRCIF